jgi:hypothetical protein
MRGEDCKQRRGFCLAVERYATVGACFGSARKWGVVFWSRFIGNVWRSGFNYGAYQVLDDSVTRPVGRIELSHGRVASEEVDPPADKIAQPDHRVLHAVGGVQGALNAI